MQFPMPLLSKGTREEFIDRWAQLYKAPNEHVYFDNIEREKTESVIQALFEWKNGSVMSARKLKRVKKYYCPGDRVNLGLNTPEDISQYVCENHAAIWNVFWLHCLDPTKFPIYDQHTHRAMMFMMGRRERLEIPATPRAKAKSYVENFMPFFSEIVGPTPTIASSRQVDRSLFNFGKFIKSVNPALL